MGGGRTDQNIPVENLIGGPAFKGSDGDWLLQMADFVAHALFTREEAMIENPIINEAFSIPDSALNRRASPRGPQGVVRKRCCVRN